VTLSISEQAASPEGATRARVGRSFVILSCLGLLLEIAASAVCHMVKKDSPLDEALSLIAMMCFVWASLLFVYRNVRNPWVTGCMVGAAAFLLFAGLLDVTGAMKPFDRSFLLGHPSNFHKVLHDVSFAAGIVFILLSFTLSALQAYRTQWRLELQNEELRRETNARVRLTSAIEQSAETVIITDNKGVVQYVNPAFETLTGYSRDEITGQTTSLLESGRHDAQYFQELWDALSRGDTWRGHFVNKKKDGSQYEVSAVISCVRDDSGTIVNYVAAEHDVTIQMNLEKRLRQAQKMEVLGTFAGQIAHDFNNILTLILGRSEMALRQLPDGDPVRGHVQHIEKAGHRAAKLIKQMLVFSRQVEQESRPVAMHLVVREVLDLLRASLPSTVHLRDAVADCGMVMADATQIHQVVMNLCTNACQALQDRGGELEVTLEMTELGSGFMPDAGHIQPGPHVRLRVRDTGNGIDSSVLPHIFDPFFTTKKTGEGTGLGLSTVAGIVDGFGGGVVVQSEVGWGSVFEVYLPGVDGTVPQAAPAQEPLVGGRERILFVDDNEEIAEMASCSLEQLGYSVTIFSSSTKALAHFRDHPNDFDIVITDQVMPEMVGTDLARALLGICPGLPIVLVSGFGHGITSEQTRAIGISEYLMKPFSDKALCLAIRRALKDRAVLSIAEPPPPLC
jgi:PAS domain S-box-containing protein